MEVSVVFKDTVFSPFVSKGKSTCHLKIDISFINVNNKFTTPLTTSKLIINVIDKVLQIPMTMASVLSIMSVMVMNNDPTDKSTNNLLR